MKLPQNGFTDRVPIEAILLQVPADLSQHRPTRGTRISIGESRAQMVSDSHGVGPQAQGRFLMVDTWGASRHMLFHVARKESKTNVFAECQVNQKYLIAGWSETGV